MDKLVNRMRLATVLRIIGVLLILSGVPLVWVSTSASSGPQQKAAPPTHHDQTQQERMRPTKTAPDLDEMIERATRAGRASQRQRVIIQLSQEKLSQMARANVLLDDDDATEEWQSVLGQYEGDLRQPLPNLGLVVAELPLARIRALAQNRAIAYLAPDRPVASLGHIENTTGAAQVRSLVSGTTLDGRGIGIAILDSGIDVKHQLNKTFSGHPGIAFAKDFTPNKNTGDQFAHGTHVASLAAGDAGAGLWSNGSYNGIAPGAKLLNLRVLGNDGRGLASYVIAAIDWCIANKAAYNIRVINLSLGTPPRDSYRTDPLCLAARRAFNAGIVVVASAGNNGRAADGGKLYGTINAPGTEPTAITVGAVNAFGTDGRNDDRITTFSSRGPTRGFTTDANGVRQYDNLIKPDLVAPGNKLIAACADKSFLPQNYPTLRATTVGASADQLLYLSGTSMSAPLVSGAVALMLQANPSLTPNLVKAILMYSAQPLAQANTLEQGAGLLNIEGAVRLARLVKTNAATLANGAQMLNSTLPTSQTSVISGQTVVWSQGVVTNYSFLYGPALMNYWQGMYGNGVTMNDATPLVNGVLTRSATLTSESPNLADGPLTTSGNGVTMNDGTLFVSSVVLGNNFALGGGVVLGDGTIWGDAVPTAEHTLFGDNTPAMQLVP